MAAASAAEGGEPPPALELAWTIDYYGGAPLVLGGVLDQPVQLTNESRAARNVYNAMQHYKRFSGTDEEYQQQFPDNHKIKNSVFKLRMEKKKRDRNR